MTRATIQVFEIGSDDDDLTLEQIRSLPTVDELPIDVAPLGIDGVTECFYDIAVDNGYKVYFDADDIRVYFVLNGPL